MIKKKWSILVMVLFILFLSALAWLLVTKYVSNIMNHSSEIYKYYKAYYIAYWWVELELTKYKSRWYWFEDTILNDSPTVTYNLNHCKNSDCYFETKARTRASIISKNERSFEESTCNLDNAIKLNSWQWIIIPLFNDLNIWEWLILPKNYNSIKDEDFVLIDIYSFDWQYKQFSIWVTDELAENNNIKKITNSSNFEVISLWETEFSEFYSESDKAFMILANIDSTTSTQYFCIRSTWKKLPYWNIVIESNWKFQDRFITLEAVKENRLPEYLIYNIINQ